MGSFSFLSLIYPLVLLYFNTIWNPSIIGIIIHGIKSNEARGKDRIESGTSLIVDEAPPSPEDSFLKHPKSRFAIGLKITIRYLIVIARNIGVPGRCM